MRLGFAIDHSRCIGCHACSVACKEEHQVPLGVYRTWVKYIEKGSFPDVRRHFSVLRCNHCDNAPCVTICPTKALFRAHNGIVDFDNAQCIGCKACMQACPYDALYIDPTTQTAAKCNFCAHRVEVGLKPSCEVVCPEQAILSGDLDDPASRISQFIHRESVTVRKPEQGTRPKLYYKDVDDHSIDPLAASRGSGYQFAQEQNGFGRDWLLGLVGESKSADAYLQDAQKRARTTYDVVHHRPWGAKVSAYIFTKSIAAGAPLCAVLGSIATPQFGAPARTFAFGLGLLFLAITSVLLVADLKRPERFLKILLRPQWRSWLAIGAYILTAYGGVLTLAFAASWFRVTALDALLHPLVAVLAVMTAIYTGFLFSQAEGRDFWQDPVLPVHLLFHALCAGAAALLLAGEAGGMALSFSHLPRVTGLGFLRVLLAVTLVLDLVVVVFSQRWMHHGTRDAVESAKWMFSGAAGRLYRWGVVVTGHLVPLAMLAFATAKNAGSGDSPSSAFQLPAIFAATVLALGGLWLYEHLWILAGQSQPLS